MDRLLTDMLHRASNPNEGGEFYTRLHFLSPYYRAAHRSLAMRRRAQEQVPGCQMVSRICSSLRLLSVESVTGWLQDLDETWTN